MPTEVNRRPTYVVMQANPAEASGVEVEVEPIVTLRHQLLYATCKNYSAKDNGAVFDGIVDLLGEEFVSYMVTVLSSGRGTKEMVTTIMDVSELIQREVGPLTAKSYRALSRS